MKPKKFTLSFLAKVTGGKCIGPPDFEVSGISGFENPRPDNILLVAEAKSMEKAGRLACKAYLLAEGIEGGDKPAVIVKNPKLAFAKLLALFHPDSPAEKGIHPSALVAPGAHVGNGAGIGPFAVIGSGARIEKGVVIGPFVYVGENVEVGEGSVICAHASLLADTVTGKRCIIREGAVIGKEGFGFAADDAGVPVRIPQKGRVVIGDDVEIGANSAVDRATLGETRIGRGTKIDNLVQVGHNCVIGENCLIAALTGIGGSATIGAHTVIGGKAGIADHAEIGEKCVIAGGSGVWGNLKPGSFVSGNPARPHKEHLRMLAALNKASEL